MNEVLVPLLRKGMLVCIDDILIYNNTLEEHIWLLCTVFQLLAKYSLKIK